MSAEPTAVGITSTTSAPTSSSRSASARQAQQQFGARHPARLGRPGPGREGGVEDVDVDREVDRPGPHRGDGPLDGRLDADLADVVHEDALDPLLALPGELLLAGPVAAEADLDVAAGVDVARFDEPPHRGAVGDLDPEDDRAGVGVGVEVDQADRPPWRAAQARMSGSAIAVVAAEDDRDRAGVEDVADGPLDRLVACRPGRRAGPGASPKSTTRSSSKASTPASRWGPGGQLAARIARGPKRAPGRSETRSSVGAPTIATSTPSSSAGSSV